MDAQIRRLVVAGTEQNGLLDVFLQNILKIIIINILDINLLTDAFHKLQQKFSSKSCSK